MQTHHGHAYKTESESWKLDLSMHFGFEVFHILLVLTSVDGITKGFGWAFESIVLKQYKNKWSIERISGPS